MSKKLLFGLFALFSAVRGCAWTDGELLIGISDNRGYRAFGELSKRFEPVKIDPSGALLNSFVELNNLALSRFSEQERSYIGVHTCPGSDRDSTHSADVDYAGLLPSLFELQAGNFYVALAGEPDRTRVLKIIRKYLKRGRRIFIGVVSPIDPRVENPEEIRDRILEAARYIPVEQLGTTDDCGFSPFCDDTSTTREKAFAKIRSRVEGTLLAEEIINGK
jgi:5-methyltetrahydropteroyltriglutamate--homocysteine methyltransferase